MKEQMTRAAGTSARDPGLNKHSYYSIRLDVIPKLWYPTTAATKNLRKS